MLRLTEEQMIPYVARRLEQYGGRTANGEVWFLCPVHEESEPSAAYRFESRPGKDAGTWYCHGCGKGGGTLRGDNPLAVLMGIDREVEITDRIEYDGNIAAEMSKQWRESRKRQEEALQDWWVKHNREDAYQHALLSNPDVVEQLVAEGITPGVMEMLGFGLTSYYDPASGSSRQALVLPWDYHDVRAVQYRLLDATPGSPGGRYRWQPGSSAGIYNRSAVDNPNSSTIVFLEGAKKVAAAISHGFDNVAGLVSKNHWTKLHREMAVPGAKPQDHPLVALLEPFDRVVFALDPDAEEQAIAAAQSIPNGYVARFPCKPDDLLAETHDPDLFAAYIEWARRV